MVNKIILRFTKTGDINRKTINFFLNAASFFLCKIGCGIFICVIKKAFKCKNRFALSD